MANQEVSVPNQFSEKPSASQVRDFHTYADTDSTSDAIHHSLGPGQNQAASGTHDHRGSNSAQLFLGISITGSRGGNTALASVISLLVEFGATDSTTA